jgi:stage II sporulation protein D
MKSIFHKLITFTLICLILLLTAEISLARDIRVKLSDSGKYSVSSGGSMTLTDGANKSHSVGKSTTLTVSGRTVISGKNKYSLPATLKSNSSIGFNGYRYRGVLRITRDGELINVLNIEDYLRGVLKAESSPTWPFEYLKVQAIVSRTFALRESQAAESRGYDVTDTTSSQVYHGMNAETQRTDQAVRETKDKVLAYGNELAFTPYHSDSGGATANNSDVWGKDLPYLISIKEPMEYQSPNSFWEARISSGELSAAITKVTSNIGTVKDIIVVDSDKNGRAVNLKIVGSVSSAIIKASAFRTAVGPNKLKSTFLVFSGVNETKQTPPANVKTENNQTLNVEINMKEDLTPKEDALLTQYFTEGAFTSEEMMEILMKPEKRKEYLYKAMTRPKGSFPQNTPKNSPTNTVRNEIIPSGKSIPFANGYFIFRGKGWGHGVGMSQYGAMNLAKSGWNAEKILAHYFPGTKVKTVTTKK